MTHEAPRSNEEVLAADECPVPNCIEPTGHGHTAPQTPAPEATCARCSGLLARRAIIPPCPDGKKYCQDCADAEQCGCYVLHPRKLEPDAEATAAMKPRTFAQTKVDQAKATIALMQDIAALRASLAAAEAREQALREALAQAQDEIHGDCIEDEDSDLCLTLTEALEARAALAKTGEPQ